MKTQISRKSHDPSKRYTGVYQQQGRMITDADWNELQDIVKERLDDALRDIVGDGVPGSGGLQIEYDETLKDLVIIPGRVYAAGAAGSPATKGKEKFPYGEQPDFPDAPGVPEVDDIVYADIWEREVTYLEDPALLDPGLGSADTCTRTQTVVQVKRLPKAANPVPAAGTGTGLLGEYYQYEPEPNKNPEFNITPMTRKVVQIDSHIEFQRGWPADKTVAPSPSVEPDYFVVRWTGFVIPVVGGNYTFYFEADDGVRLWIGEEIVIDAWPNDPWTTVSNNAGVYKNTPKTLQAGKPYTIRVEFYNAKAPWRINMYWSNDGGNKQIIPRSQLYPPSALLIPSIGDALLTVTHRGTAGGSTMGDPDATEIDPEERTGNYVFRVEVHDVDGPPHAPNWIKLKWSSENASEAHRGTTWTEMPDDFIAQDWAYEFYSDKTETHLGAHFVDKDSDQKWRPERGPFYTGAWIEWPGGSELPFVRRWDGHCELERDAKSEWTVVDFFDGGVKLPQPSGHGAAGVEDGMLTLELASLTLALVIQGRTFLAGDHWLVAVRETDNTKDSIVTNAKPVGILHRYVKLGIVKGAVGALKFEPVKRRAFPTLADLASVEPNNSGASKIGADAITSPGSGTGLSAGTVRSQLQELVAAVNKSLGIASGAAGRNAAAISADADTRLPETTNASNVQAFLTGIIARLDALENPGGAALLGDDALDSKGGPKGVAAGTVRAQLQALLDLLNSHVRPESTDHNNRYLRQYYSLKYYLLNGGTVTITDEQNLKAGITSLVDLTNPMRELLPLPAAPNYIRPVVVALQCNNLVGGLTANKLPSVPTQWFSAGPVVTQIAVQIDEQIGDLPIPHYKIKVTNGTGSPAWVWIRLYTGPDTPHTPTIVPISPP